MYKVKTITSFLSFHLEKLRARSVTLKVLCYSRADRVKASFIWALKKLIIYIVFLKNLGARYVILSIIKYIEFDANSKHSLIFINTCISWRTNSEDSTRIETALMSLSEVYLNNFWRK